MEIPYLVERKKCSILGGEAARISAAFFNEGLVAVAEIEGVVPSVELVPVQDRFQLRRIGPLRLIKQTIWQLNLKAVLFYALINNILLVLTYILCHIL